MKKVRIDKWLWAVRIYKTRTLATKQIGQGSVLVEGERVKPSYALEIGKELLVKKNGYNYTILVEKLIEKRVGAALAIECYQDLTPEDELRKFDSQYIGKGRNEIREKGLGRPTKKERRNIDTFKDDWLNWEPED